MHRGALDTVRLENTATCTATGEEYTNTSDQVLFSPFHRPNGSDTHPLASTPNADFCVPDSHNAIYWLSAFNVRPSIHPLPLSTCSLVSSPAPHSQLFSKPIRPSTSPALPPYPNTIATR